MDCCTNIGAKRKQCYPFQKYNEKTRPTRFNLSTIHVWAWHTALAHFESEKTSRLSMWPTVPTEYLFLFLHHQVREPVHGWSCEFVFFSGRFAVVHVWFSVFFGRLAVDHVSVLPSLRSIMWESATVILEAFLGKHASFHIATYRRAPRPRPLPTHPPTSRSVSGSSDPTQSAPEDVTGFRKSLPVRACLRTPMQNGNEIKQLCKIMKNMTKKKHRKSEIALSDPWLHTILPTCIKTICKMAKNVLRDDCHFR